MPMKYDIDRDRENGSGIFYAYWRENGRQKRKSLKTTDEVEAQKALGAILQTIDHQAAAIVKGSEPTIADCWEVYRKKCLSKGRSERGATYKWEAFLKPYFGHYTVPQVTKSVVEKYVEGRLNGKFASAKGNVIASTVRGELIKLRSCLNFCAEYEDDNERTMIEKSAIRKWEFPESGKPRDRFLEWEEIDRLLAAARLRRVDGKISRVELFIHLALGTAGRESAIYDLTYGRCDYARRTIDLDDGARLPGDKGRAKVYMSDDLFAVLRQAESESDHSIPRDKRLVMIHKATVWPTMQRVVYDAGLAPQGWTPPTRYEQPKKTGISPHILRHTAATHMVSGGIPLAKVAKYLGNSLAMVEKVYSHLQPDHLKDAAAIMSRGLRKVPTQLGDVA
jgi:integrase